jgi:hypothetical protein
MELKISRIKKPINIGSSAIITLNTLVDDLAIWIEQSDGKVKKMAILTQDHGGLVVTCLKPLLLIPRSTRKQLLPYPKSFYKKNKKK